MRTQKILFIRHGQSAFNAAFDDSGIDPLLPNARLTSKGQTQVLAARELLRDVPFDLVVVTPLTRALQTAFGIFEHHFSEPPFVVEALHRERLESSCDVGRPPAALLVDYPDLDFQHLADSWWHVQGQRDARGFHVEPFESAMERIAQFRTFLSRRPERSIAVVGHGTFFYYLTGVFLPNCGMIELTSKRFDNSQR